MVERCALQERPKEVVEELVQGKVRAFNSALGRCKKRKVTLLLSLQVNKKL